MKVLYWDGHDGRYCSNINGATHPIRDISEDDVLSIMRIILEGTEPLEMDENPVDEKNANPAAVVIYKELRKQFCEMISQRKSIIDRVDKQFETARRYYAQEDVQELFIDESAELDAG